MNERTNAADVFPSGEPTADIGLVLQRIRAMLNGCGSSDRNQLVFIAITALVEAGVNTGPRIVGAARSLGFKASHAGAVLGKSTGPGRSFSRGRDGVYSLNAAKVAA